MKKIYQNTEKNEYVTPEVKISSTASYLMMMGTVSGGGSAKAGEIFSDDENIEESKPTMWDDNEE